jgi:DNA-binding transcriptional LysR family regulator
VEMILDERVLRLILILAEELHFGRAAARLHVSQPTLSGAVKNVERGLGVQLFLRSSRHVELTEAGIVLVAEARRLIDQAVRTVALVRARAKEYCGPLRVGYGPSINLDWFCGLISRARGETEAHSAIELVSAEPSDLERELAKGTLHAGFLLGASRNPELRAWRVYTEKFILALSRLHHLARHEMLTFNQIKGEPVIWLRRDLNASLWPRLLSAGASCGYNPSIVQEVRTFHECLHFAREGLGITFLPSDMRRSASCDGIVFREMPEPFHVDANLVVRRDARFEQLIWFTKFVREYVREARNPGIYATAVPEKSSAPRLIEIADRFEK